MKRFLLLLVAAGGGVLWWQRRASHRRTMHPSPTLVGEGSPTSADDVPAPAPLGGDVDPELLEILACPVDHEPVSREGNYLVCQSCQRHYAIRDGIPVMLIDEALTPEQAAAQQV